MHLSKQRQVVGAGIAAAAVALYHVHSQPETYHLLQTVPRTARLLSWAAKSYLRYHAEVCACGDQSELSVSTLSNLQRTNARELAKVCKNNGGIFIKAAQFASNIAKVPTEYREELGALGDNSCVLPGDVVRAMIEADTKQSVNNVFQQLSDEPIAAASLAQVHRGVLKDGREVAVKVQYPGIGYAAAADLRVCSWIASACTAVGVPGIAPVQRILKSLIRRISEETNLKRELGNALRLQECLPAGPVTVAQPLPEYSSRRVLVTEWVDGVEVTDTAALQRRGISAKAVGQELLNAFAETVYVRGCMHGDLSPANILVRGSGDNFEVVLLDHGWQVAIPFKLRRQYCKLWCSFVLHDEAGALAVAEEIAGPCGREIVPVVLQMTSGKRVGRQGDGKQHGADGLRGLGGLQNLAAISHLPPELVEILRVSHGVRGVTSMLGLTAADRLDVNCRHALEGLSLEESVRRARWAGWLGLAQRGKGRTWDDWHGVRSFREREASAENLYFNKEEERLLRNLLKKMKSQADKHDDKATAHNTKEGKELEGIVGKYKMSEEDFQALMQWKHS
eukprot:jgi/Ulvmu1/4674/UM002_0405.1